MDLHGPATPPLTGAVQLADGTWVRGRGVRRAVPPGPQPDFGLYLGVQYRPAWPHAQLVWPDFGLPGKALLAARLLQAVHTQAQDGQRVEVGCAGGRGRTGTALAALSILAGTDPADAVSWVRRTYDHHAVETPWQRRWVRRFPGLLEVARACQDGSGP